MSELVQIKGHNQVSTHENDRAEKSRGKKLILIDLANCEDMSIKREDQSTSMVFLLALCALQHI